MTNTAASWGTDLGGWYARNTSSVGRPLKKKGLQMSAVSSTDLGVATHFYCKLQSSYKNNKNIATTPPVGSTD